MSGDGAKKKCTGAEGILSNCEECGGCEDGLMGVTVLTGPEGEVALVFSNRTKQVVMSSEVALALGQSIIKAATSGEGISTGEVVEDTESSGVEVKKGVLGIRLPVSRN